MKQVRTNVVIDYAPKMGTIENGIIIGTISSPVFPEFGRLETNWRYAKDTGEVVAQGGKFISDVQALMDAVSPMMTKSFDTDFLGALEESSFIALKLEMYQTFIGMNPTLTLSDFIIEDIV